MPRVYDLVPAIQRLGLRVSNGCRVGLDLSGLCLLCMPLVSGTVVGCFKALTWFLGLDRSQKEPASILDTVLRCPKT